MKKRQVNFYMLASGLGTAGSNGASILGSYYEENGKKKYANNYLVPKLTGLQLTEKFTFEKDGETITQYRQADAKNIDFSKSKLFLSIPALKQAFSSTYFDSGADQYPTSDDYLTDIRKLFLTGFMLPSEQLGRASAIRFSNFLAILQNLTHEINSNNTTKNGETGGGLRHTISSPGRNVYAGIGRLAVENLQFVAFDGAAARVAYDGSTLVTGDAMALNEKGQKVESNINTLLQAMADELGLTLKPRVTLGFVRKYGTHKPMFGLKLNQDGIKLHILWVISDLNRLLIDRASGFAQVDSVVVDVSSGTRVHTKFIEDGVAPSDVDSDVLNAEFEDIYVSVSHESAVSEWLSRKQKLGSEKLTKSSESSARKENDAAKTEAKKKKSLE